MAHPWLGGSLSQANAVDTTAILQSGRPTRVLLTYDAEDAALHLSVSHPRLAAAGLVALPPTAVELPSMDEVDAWSRVFFGPRHHLTDVEVGKVVHVRLYLDVDGKPIPPAVRGADVTKAGPL